MAKVLLKNFIFAVFFVVIIKALYSIIHHQDIVAVSGRTGEFHCDVPRLVNLEDFFIYGRRETNACKIMKKYGGIGRYNDGSKVLCQDFVLTPGKCTVLSFGINNEWSFDDAISRIGCEIYAFDPSMGMKDYNRSKQIHFYNLGLSNARKITYVKGKLWKLDRYENILRKLSLTDVDIDCLKMDVEGAEIEFMEDIVNSSIKLIHRVKQIAMEVHVGIPPKRNNEEAIRNTAYQKIWKLMHQMECLGFAIANYEMNPMRSNHFNWKDRKEASCYEILWVRTT